MGIRAAFPHSSNLFLHPLNPEAIKILSASIGFDKARLKGLAGITLFFSDGDLQGNERRYRALTFPYHPTQVIS
jgi:hypothetical protein